MSSETLLEEGKESRSEERVAKMPPSVTDMTDLSSKFHQLTKIDEKERGVVPFTAVNSNPSRPPELQFNFEDTLKKLRADLVKKREEEKRILKNMKEILRKPIGGNNISKALNLSIARHNNRMTMIESDAKQLASSLKVLSSLADNISSKVSALDVAKGRIVECLQRVNDLMDMRTCTEGVQEAMRHDDYEEAARHIQRFLQLDNALFREADQTRAESNEAGTYSMKKNYEILRSATDALKKIVEDRFDEAVAKGDLASLQRFFKLFPLVNEHSNGISRLGEFLRKEISKMAEKNYQVMLAGGIDEKRSNILYADSLTMLFEGIAREIQVYEPLIDNSYGPEKMLSLIEILQVECDKEAARILDKFTEKRQYVKKAKLVEKFSRNPDKYPSSEKMDALELDVVLSEVTLMHTRAELYWRYLKRRLATANTKMDEQMKAQEDDDLSEDERQKRLTVAGVQKLERDRKLDNIVNRSVLGTRMQELLGQYILMEEYYMKESVAKAISMDAKEDGCLTSSVLDDVFFIVRKCIRRSLSSSSVDCVCAMLNDGVTTLEVHYLKLLGSVIKSGYPSVGWTAEAYQTAQTAYNVIQRGQTVADAGPEKQKQVFLTALNNIRASIECTKTLKQTLSDDLEKHLTNLSDVEKGKRDNALNQLDDLIATFERSANHGVDRLCAAAFRPKLKSSAELYMDITHTPSESEFADFEAEDPFMNNFIASLDRQLAAFQPLLVPANYQELLSCVCIEVMRQLERVIFKSVYNRLGGLQLDKEFRSLASYLSGVGGWAMREKCSRLSQIVALLNVDSAEEAVEYYQNLQTDRHLTSEIARKILALRTDIPVDVIRQSTF